VSEHVRVEMEGDLFKVNAAGDMGSSFSEWTRDSDDLLDLKADEDSSATFTLSYLNDIANAAGANSEVATLELSTDMPIKMEFEIPQGRLVYYLAPCIGV